MYQGLRAVGGLLVILGMLFAVAAGFVALQWEERMRVSAQKSREDVSEAAWKFTAKDDPSQKGDLASPAGAAYTQWMEKYDSVATQSVRPFQEVTYLYCLAVGMVDLAVIGLGLGLRATADMADRMARVAIKRPA